MAAPIKLTSADSGAPTLSGEDGKLYDVFKWALPLLGWTIEFDDPALFRIVFRNDNADGGSGSYLRIVDRNADHGTDARCAQANAYESMSDIDTGVRRTPDTLTLSLIAKSSATGATTRKWEIWGDKYRFVFRAWLDTTSNDQRTALFLCGDLQASNSLDQVFIIHTATAVPTTIYNTLDVRGYLNTYAIFNLIRNLAGTSGPLAAGIMALSPGTTSPTLNLGTTGPYIDPERGVARFAPMIVCDSTRIRGIFPGVYLPIGNWTGEHGYDAAVANCQTPDGPHTLRIAWGNRSTSANGTAGSLCLLIDETDGWGSV
jgi:hypothetical protein